MVSTVVCFYRHIIAFSYNKVKYCTYPHTLSSSTLAFNICFNNSGSSLYRSKICLRLISLSPLAVVVALVACCCRELASGDNGCGGGAVVVCHCVFVRGRSGGETEAGRLPLADIRNGKRKRRKKEKGL